MPDAFCASCPFLSVTASAKPLTKRQADLLMWLMTYTQKQGCAPSFEEIAAHYGFRSLATVHEHLTNLQQKGYLVRAYKHERGMTFTTAAKEWAANHV